ncbi:MAG TPA: hypothetical protein VLI54_04460 [Bacillota bacterium]|nr:hypothetical protein [Bacillota bacterium]
MADPERLSNTTPIVPSIVEDRFSGLTQLGELITEQQTHERAFLARNAAARGVLATEVIPEVRTAITATHDLAITSGEFTSLNEASLAHAGTALAGNIQSYADPFVLASDALLSPDTPRLGIRIAPVLLERDPQRSVFIAKDELRAHHPNDAPRSFTTHDTRDYEFHGLKIDLPVLVDPTEYTLKEYLALPYEAADGFAAQVVSGWRGLREQYATDAAYHRAPRIIRAIGVLPLSGPRAEKAVFDHEYAFTPSVTFPPSDDGDLKRTYGVHMLVRGEDNAGGRSLRRWWSDKQSLNVMAAAGRHEAPLVVSRQGEAVPEGDMPGTLTPRSQGAVAIYLAPHTVHNKLRSAAPAPPSSAGSYMMSSDTPKMISARGGLGSASVEVGTANWGSNTDYNDPYTEVRADTSRPATIFVLQLLTIGR